MTARTEEDETQTKTNIVPYTPDCQGFYWDLLTYPENAAKQPERTVPLFASLLFRNNECDKDKNSRVAEARERLQSCCDAVDKGTLTRTLQFENTRRDDSILTHCYNWGFKEMQRDLKSSLSLANRAYYNTFYKLTRITYTPSSSHAAAKNTFRAQQFHNRKQWAAPCHVVSL